MQAPPKFASFRARPAPPSAPVPDLVGAPAAFPRSQNSRQSEERARGLRHYNSHEYSSQTRGRSDDILIPAPRQEGRDEGARPGDAFVVDRKGDPNIQQYGTNNKSSIPSYWSPATVRTLGEKTPWLSHSRRSLLSSLGREERRALNQEQVCIIPGGDHSAKAPLSDAEDFMSLKPSRVKRVTRSRTNLPATGFSAGNPLNQKIDTSDESSEGTDATAEVENATSPLKLEHARLANLVKTHPAKVQAWLEYIAFQEVWVTNDRYADNHILTNTELHGLTDVKLSLYKKALDKVPRGDAAYEKLLIAMLHECETVLEHFKLLSRWGKAVEENPSMKSLLFEFTTYCQSSFASFSTEKCQDLFARCLTNSVTNQDFPGAQAYLFLRLTRLITDAGYKELAFALWQAMFELHCFSSIEYAIEGGNFPADCLTNFEYFWDNENPRIGEAGAHGWSIPASTSASVDQYRRQSSPEVVGHVHNRFFRWFANESHASRNSTLSGRTMDDFDDDDPFHVVLFPDIKPFLHPIAISYPPVDLINSFLAFHSLPILWESASPELISLIARDSFITSSILDGTANALLIGEGMDASTKYLRYDTLMQSSIITADNISLISNGGSSPFSSMSGDSQKRDFVSNTLQTLIERFPEWESLAEYTVAFEADTNSVSAAKKYVRSLLKIRSSNLRLYNAYALLEARTNNPGAADKVFQTAITMSSTFDVSDRQHVIILWRSWIWHAIDQGNHELAFERFCKLAALDPSSWSFDTKPSPAALSHTTALVSEHLSALLTSAIQKRHHLHAIHIIDLLSVLRYLAPHPSSPSLTSALTTYATAFSLLPSNPTYTFTITPSASASASPNPRSPTLVLEILHQHRARLIDHHIRTKHSYRPLDVRAALEESIALFPSNTLFLSLHRTNERRNRIDDRVRELAREIITRPRSQHPINSTVALQAPGESHIALGGAPKGARSFPTYFQPPNPADNIRTHFFAITTELQRDVLSGSTRYSVRAAFERAAKSRACRNSPSLWCAWVDWELSLLPVQPFDLPVPNPALGPVNAHVHATSDRTPIAGLDPKTNTKTKIKHTASERASRDWEEQRVAVRDVFFRGLRNLPWVKEYAMLALGPLRARDVVSDEECAAVYEGMVTRGLRVRVELA